MKVGDKVFVCSPDYMKLILSGGEPARGVIVEQHKYPSGTISIAQLEDGSLIDNSSHSSNQFFSQSELSEKIQEALSEKKADLERISKEVKALTDCANKMHRVESKTKGTHGACTWVINNNILYIYPTNGISGMLATPGAFEECHAPWYSHAWEIKKVIVAPGVRVHPDSAFLFAELPFCEEMELSSLITEGLRDGSHMFWQNVSLRKLDISQFDTRRLKNIMYMLSECSALTDLKLFYIPEYCRDFGKFHACHRLRTYDTLSGRKKVGCKQ
jgi:hypothetical protein